MRILIDYRPALSRRTGVGEYAHEIARALGALLRRDESLTLFSSSWKDRLDADRVPGAGVVDARIPVRLLNLLWHRLEWPPVERLAGAVDIAHSMHPLLLPARAAAQVVTIYDLFFLRDAAGAAPEIRRDYPALAAAHARRAAAVVVISNYTAREVTTHLGVAPSRLVLCPPGAPPWPRRDPPTPGGPILYVGSAERRKNVAGLLRAYARLRAWLPGAPDLVMAGRPPEPGSEVAAMIASPVFRPHVRHLGYVPDEERQRLYPAAAMLVMPSFDEGFGIPVLEAMTVGVPVVAADRGALPEVSGGAAQLVDPTDDEAIAAAMRRILENPGMAQAGIEAGCRRAAEYSWTASAERLLQAYREVLARRGAHA